MSESWEALVAAHREVEARLAGDPDRSERPLRHKPNAAILACADARVPPSVIFDQPAGSLFVVRIAGNTAVPSTLASLDYAVAKLGVDLIVVLGHTGCGAVTAAVDGICDGHLEPIVAPIRAIARSNPAADIDHISLLSVASTMRTLAQHDGPVGHAAATGQLQIRGAIHDLRSGRLSSVPTASRTKSQSPVEAT